MGGDLVLNQYFIKKNDYFMEYPPQQTNNTDITNE